MKLVAMKVGLLLCNRAKSVTKDPKTNDKSIIGTKWVFRDKLEEDEKVVKNKVRLVPQEYSQQELYF